MRPERVDVGVRRWDSPVLPYRQVESPTDARQSVGARSRAFTPPPLGQGSPEGFRWWALNPLPFGRRGRT